jgi:hypothetical protein
MKYKVGNKVRLICENRWTIQSHLKINEVYTLKEVDESCVYLEEEKLGFVFPNEMFELICEKTINEKFEFVTRFNESL